MRQGGKLETETGILGCLALLFSCLRLSRDCLPVPPHSNNEGGLILRSLLTTQWASAKPAVPRNAAACQRLGSTLICPVAPKPFLG